MSITHEVPLRSTRAASRRGAFHLPQSLRWWLAVLTVLAVGSWVNFALHLLQGGTYQPADPAVATAPACKKPPTPLGPHEIVEGPWGRLEMVPITIAPPLECLWQASGNELYETAWFFPKTNKARLTTRLAELGLSEPLQAELLLRAKADPSIDGHTIRPSKELVLKLSPEDRAKLYVELHGYPENKAQSEAFRFCGTSSEPWFGDAPILPETKRLVESLIYRRGGFMFFADRRTIEPMLPSDQERLALIRALTRESTWMLNLKISAETDVDALVRYWGRGGRTEQLRPILEALTRLPGKQSLEVSRLLPPFARQRIFTYMPSSSLASAVVHDCHWSATNFFSQQPEERLGKGNTVFDIFAKDYYRIYGNPQFGDIVIYFDEHEGVIHSAVYIAADVVFTKNGHTCARPWMFLKAEDMKHYYPRTKGLRQTYFRRKGM